MPADRKESGLSKETRLTRTKNTIRVLSGDSSFFANGCLGQGIALEEDVLAELLQNLGFSY